jgi:DNA-binding response OmpR family regulator
MDILLVEDDKTLNRNIHDMLTAENFFVTAVFDGHLAEKLMNKKAFDCIILDVNLPYKNGFDLCKEFRTSNKNTPILLLTAFGDLDDKITGYHCGADDYLTKPFYMRELLLRINALIKRKVSTKNILVLTASDVSIDMQTKIVLRQNKEINLTPREFQLLVKLAKNPGEIISKNDLVKEIWGNVVEVNTNTIEVYINFLRNKLDKPFGKNSIKTKVGFGYYFDTEERGN